MQGTEVRKFVVTMKEALTRRNKVTIRLGMRTEENRRHRAMVVAYIIEQFQKHSINRKIILVHRGELDPRLFEHIASEFTSFPLDGDSYEELMQQLWSLQELVRRNRNEISLVLYYEIEDIFPLLGGDLRKVEKILSLTLEIRTSSVFLYFLPPFSMNSEIPYQSFFDNFDVRFYLLSRRVM